jgi:NADPH:quinone reductase-like Zn-dependent oxidoreductase
LTSLRCTFNLHRKLKAIVYERYGPPEVLEFREVEMPEVPDDGLLVRVRASSVNPVDWHMMTGTPFLVRILAGLRRPKDIRLGSDFAGTVEAVGTSVERFRPGDEVFGTKGDCFAEYTVVAEDGAVARKPANVTFEQAGTVGVAGISALQALRDKAGLQSGQKVLINGASGGVGTFAVQIAKAMGAEVTGICSTGKVELVHSIGADRVVDYTREDFTRDGTRYDVIVDNAGGRSLSDFKRVLTGDGAYVSVGGQKGGWLLGPAARMVKTRLASIGASQKIMPFMAKPNSGDLAALAELLEAGKVTPVIDRRYELSRIADAFDYLGQRHARAKIAIGI